MMTLEEIRAAKINTVVSREAHDQASKRLSDALDTKKTLEQKAFVLFNAYITLSAALFGVGGFLLKTTVGAVPAWPFFIAGIVFLSGTFPFVYVLFDKDYGALGSDPGMWLDKETMEGDDSVLPRMLAYITFHHKERISKSEHANNLKAKAIRMGIFLGLAAPILLALGLAIAPS
jgi:hypothetical protein